MSSDPGEASPPPPPPTSDAPPRPLGAAVLSALIPGLGQWYAGYRRRAWAHLAVTALFVVPVAVLLILVFFVSGLGLAVDLSRPFFRQPGLLWLLLAVNLVLLGFRAGSVIDAYVVASRDPRASPVSRSASALFTIALAALLVVVAVPHAWAGQRNLALHDLLTHDFVTDPHQSTTSTSTTTTSTLPTPGGSATTTSTTSTTTTTMPDPFAAYDRINILLLGSDAGVGRIGDRTDTMIVVSVDPRSGDTAMVSIPRNIVHLPIPDGHPAYAHWPDGLFGRPDYISWAVYQYGRANPELFEGPNTGGDASKVILGNLVGLDVHFFALVNLQGFVDIIDAIGGVELTLTERLYDPTYPHEDGSTIVVDFPPGTHHMNGHEALAFVRTRRGSDDYDRMQRQRCLVEALARQAEPVTLLRNFPSLVPAITESVITDIPVPSMPDFIELLAKIDTTEIVSLRIMPSAPDLAGTGLGYIAYTVEGYGAPNVPLIRERMEIATTLPPLEAMQVLNLQPLDEICGTD